MYEGDVPVGNWRESPDWHEAAARLGGAAHGRQHPGGPPHLLRLPHRLQARRRGPGRPIPTAKGAGPESETVAAFGTLLGNDNLEAVARANDLCNRLGMDTISCGATIAFAIECFEHGLLTPADTGGLALRWGDVDTALALIAADRRAQRLRRLAGRWLGSPGRAPRPGRRALS